MNEIDHLRVHMAACGIGVVEPSGSATRELVHSRLTRGLTKYMIGKGFWTRVQSI
jgi:hypothetical protein